jgi:hypothetical protein
MFRLVFILTLSLLIFSSCHVGADNSVLYKPGYIDSIQQAKQITAFIHKVDSNYKKFVVNDPVNYESRYAAFDYKRVADSLGVRPWSKADFDKNGLTDLLVIGYFYEPCILVILNKGGHYEIKQLTRSAFQDHTFPVVENNSIRYSFQSNHERINPVSPARLETVTLVYQFGDFIEENPSPANHGIEKIEYTTTGCFGTCPVFRMTIGKDRSSVWEAIRFNRFVTHKSEGTYSCTITEDNYTEITNLLNYIDFEKLHHDYAVTWTDDQHATITITYDNGKTKTILDYGLIGTYGLNRVHQLMFKLRENQDWIKQ